MTPLDTALLGFIVVVVFAVGVAALVKYIIHGEMGGRG